MSLLVLSLTLLIMSTLTIGGTTGITIDLIHRDSALNSTTSHVDKLYASFRRSIERASAVATMPPVDSRVILRASGEYAIELGLGTPPTKFLAMVDTGSDLIWTPCLPCIHCFDEGNVDPVVVFNPSTSTTYKPLSCHTNGCSWLQTSDCSDDGVSTCLYRYDYGFNGDGPPDYSSGNLATETLTIFGVGGDSFTVSGVAFGCSHDNPGSTSALIGFGQGSLSLTSQTKGIPALGGKFAYCLVPPNSGVNSKISFGENAVVSGDGAFSTPMANTASYYLLTLEAVKVRDETVAHLDSKKDEGNIMIDSGSTLTYFPQAIFDAIVAKLRSEIKAEPVADPWGYLKLCYRGQVEVPRISFMFKGGVTLGLATNNVFRLHETVLCLTMLPIPDEDENPSTSVLGNIAQINFLVGYNLEARTVSFKATDCTNYV